MFKFIGILTAAATLGAGAAAQTQSSGSITVFATSSRTLRAVNYRQDGRSKIGFQGTALAASAKGEASVDVKRGVVQVEAKIGRLAEPASYGPEFLTYVLWAVTPEGRSRNLGELGYQGGKSELKTSVPLQEFGLFVTAEPYFSVTVPSYAVVAENVIVAGTQGRISALDVKVELFERGHYSGIQASPTGPNVPNSLRQARLAVQVAKAAKAEEYASESLAKAESSLAQAEAYQARKGNNQRPVTMVAREAAQAAEDARVIATKRLAEDRLAAERAEAAQREATARSAAAQEAARAEQAARDKQTAEAARTTAEQQRLVALAESRAAGAEREAALIAKREAERERLLAQAASAEAEQRSKAALADMEASKRVAQEAKVAAEEARQLREAAEKERALMAEERNRAVLDKQALRSLLLDRFNKVLETRDTERGLVLNMGDVLFDTGKFNLRPVARERLARLSGILSAYPGLALDIEGHTDSTGLTP